MRGHPFSMVIGVDLSEYTDTVLTHGIDQAVRHDEPTVHVVTVIPHPGVEEATRARLVDVIQRTLDEELPPALKVVAHVRCGRPEEELVELAEESLASLIVVGRFGASHRRHGSIADLIVTSASCPVLVVPAPRDTSASDAQCDACVQLRRDTDGETWFCERHHGEHVGHATAVIGSAVSPGRSMW